MKAKAAIAFEKAKPSGYDHGYYFINSFIEEHISYHVSILKNID
jgi:S-formylglutathione hydrolase